jgi:hypothetical protein
VVKCSNLFGEGAGPGTRNRGIFGGAIGRPGGRRRCRVGKVSAVDVTRPESSSPSTAETDADGGWEGLAHV